MNYDSLFMKENQKQKIPLHFSIFYQRKKRRDRNRAALKRTTQPDGVTQWFEADLWPTQVF